MCFMCILGNGRVSCWLQSVSSDMVAAERAVSCPGNEMRAMEGRTDFYWRFCHKDLCPGVSNSWIDKRKYKRQMLADYSLERHWTKGVLLQKSPTGLNYFKWTEDFLVERALKIRWSDLAAERLRRKGPHERCIYLLVDDSLGDKRGLLDFFKYSKLICPQMAEVPSTQIWHHNGQLQRLTAVGYKILTLLKGWLLYLTTVNQGRHPQGKHIESCRSFQQSNWCLSW